MKIRKMAVLALALMAASSSMGATEKVGDYTWTYRITDEGSVEIYGNSSSPAIFPKPNDAVVIPSVLGGKPVTIVGAHAFNGCSGLTSVTIPASVTCIGYNAFGGCSGLTSVTVPESVTRIGASAFSGCSALMEITLPFVGSKRGNVGKSSSLFGYIFGTMSYAGGASTRQYYTLYPLTSSYTIFYIPETLCRVTITDETVLAYGAFYNCSNLSNVTIGNNVTNIGSSAFCGCTGLTSMTIPNSVTTIGSSAFSGCSGLASVTIGNSVTSIGSSAFSGCFGLTGMTIPNSVTSIGAYAFNGCSGLSDVTIGSSVTNVEYGAFIGCSGLKSVHITDLAQWCGCSFSNVDANPLYYARNLYLSGEKISALELPDGVTSIGAFTFRGCDGLTSVSMPNSVTDIGVEAFRGCENLSSVTIPDSVTSIGNYAFYGCSGLTSITIPNSVASIGNYAFYDCRGLINALIPNSATRIGDRAFYGCSGLAEDDGLIIVRDVLCGYIGKATEVVIPDSVTSIGNYAFSGCSVLTSVTIPNSVTRIGDHAFYGCSGLATVTIPDSVTSVGNQAFKGCSGLVDSKGFAIVHNVLYDYFGEDGDVTIPDSVTSIGERVFYGRSGLTRVTIPTSVTDVGDYAFRGCSGLTTVTIPDSVTNIGVYAFWGCSGLTSITIPDSVTYIETGMFDECSALTSVTIPGSVEGIGYGAFYDCNGLRDVYITDIAQWCGCSFSNADANPLYYAHNLYLNGEKITALEFPDGVTNIGAFTFRGCDDLTSVSMPSSVTEIGEEAFAWCKNLTSVTIPDSVTSIGDMAFHRCSGLTTVAIPNSVMSIGDSAFEACRSLTSVTISDSLTSIADSMFRNCGDLTGVTIPNSVTNIGEFAFHGCENLVSMTIPDSVMGIGSRAFLDCTRLKNVTIGESLTSIGNCAFEQCRSLTSVTIPNSVADIGEAAFRGCNSLATIYVDSGDVARVRELFEESGLDTSALTFVELVDTPVVTPGDGATFDDDKCTVTIACGTEGASIYYSTNGVTPRASAQYLYSGPFEIDGTVQIVAFAMKNGSASEYAEAAITKVVTPLTLALALDEEKLGEIATGGDAEWTPQRDAGAKAGKSVARSGAVGMNQETWLETTVRGKGTLTFWWKTSCEADPRGRHTYDHLTFSTAEGELYWLDGNTDWQQRSVTFDTDGDHTIRWTYSTDDWEEPGYQNCGWVDGVVWTGAASSGAMPSVVGDSDAVVTGDEANGFVVRPSSGVDDVEVVIPDGIVTSMVVVEVPTTAKSVTPNGATLKIVKIIGEERYDITKYLEMPDPAVGRVDVSKIEVQQKYADQVFDFAEGARFDLDAVNPITTARTEPGLTYILMEGRTLDSMKEGDSKVGDGNVWTPRVSVKGGSSGFYRIKVVK